MQTEEAKVINSSTGVFVNLPLTQTSGKIRIKQRSFFAEYGLQIAPRQVALTQSCYIEWQIGYDLLKNAKNIDKTSIQDKCFENYKGEKKFAYELSEIVLYAFKHGLITSDEIRQCYDCIANVREEQTFEKTSKICRTHPEERIVNGLPFYEMVVSYPLFVHRFGKYEILAEVMIREKQKAVGTQAMLYVCLPVTSLTFERQGIGRTLDVKECAEWHIGKDEAALSLELFRVFGMLSPKHRHDVMAILKMLFAFL